MVVMKTMAILIVLALFSVSIAAAPARYEIVSEKSRVTFTSEAPLDTVEGSTRQVSGEITFDPGRLSLIKGRVVANLISLDTGNRLRDKDMREDFLETDLYPTVTFELAKAAPAVLKAGKNQLSVVGTFSLHGVSRRVTVPVTVDFDPQSGRLEVSSRFTILLKDYRIKRPELFFMRVAEEVGVKVRIVAKR